MSLQELKERAYQLSVRDRLELIEAIAISLKTAESIDSEIKNDLPTQSRTITEGWDEAFKAMDRNGDDRLEKDREIITDRWDEEEWE